MEIRGIFSPRFGHRLQVEILAKISIECTVVYGSNTVYIITGAEDISLPTYLTVWKMNGLFMGIDIFSSVHLFQIFFN